MRGPGQHGVVFLPPVMNNAQWRIRFVRTTVRRTLYLYEIFWHDNFPYGFYFIYTSHRQV